MLTINGTGVTIYGAAHPTPLPIDQNSPSASQFVPCSYQVVKWVTILFLPIVPLGVFRVVRARRTFWSFATPSYLMQPVAWDWRQVMTHYAVAWSAPLLIVSLIGLLAFLQNANTDLAMRLELPLLMVIIFSFLAASVLLLKMLFASEPPENLNVPMAAPFTAAQPPVGSTEEATPFASQYAQPTAPAFKHEHSPFAASPSQTEDVVEVEWVGANSPAEPGAAATPPVAWQASPAAAYPVSAKPAEAFATPPPPAAKSNGTSSLISIVVTLVILLVSGLTFLVCAGVAYSIVARRAIPLTIDSPEQIAKASDSPQVIASSGKKVTMADELSGGDDLLAEWAGDWYRAQVLQPMPDGQVRIRWIDWGPAFDEVVERDRLQFVK